MKTLIALALLMAGCAGTLTDNQRNALIGLGNGLASIPPYQPYTPQVGTYANPVHVYQPLVITPQPPTPPCCD